ncbi:MAG: SulP family inorganic anion transporter [Bacteroidia bacterium]
MEKKPFFSSIKSDLPASLVVFLVAMPLCLGIALASGAPLFSGIIAGIVGGIVVGSLSASPLGVSGPAAGLAVIVLTSIQELGSFDIFLYAVVIAGIFQLALGYLKAGVIGYYFPSSVIKGMLTGIGIIIVLKQIPHAFGYDKSPEGELSFLQSDGHNTFNELFYMFNSISPGVLIITAVSLGILILWEQSFMKRQAVFRIVQGPLVAVIAGILLTSLFKGIDNLTIAPEHMVSIPAASSISGFFGQFSFPDFSQWNNAEVYITAITIAVVASLETLLCVEATDKLDPQKRVTPTNRELKAQGVGNLISGLVGGLPITQVIVRSSANIQSGGKTKASAIFHGILLLGATMALPNLINSIPLASLAAILFLVGYKLAKPSVIREMLKKGKAQYVPFLVTILGIVFTDLLIGISLGLVVAAFHVLYKNLKLPYHLDYEAIALDEPIVIRLAEEVSFLNKASILQTFNHLPDGSTVTLDISGTKTIDMDVLEIIEDFKINAPSRDITLKIIDPNPGKRSDYQNQKGYSIKYVKAALTSTKETKSQ